MQAEAHDYPVEFFEPKVWHIRRPQPDGGELARVAALIKAAKNPVIISGGGTIYSQAEEVLGAFATRHNIPVAETQAGKSGLPQSHPMNFGASGVDGSAAANAASETADLVIGVGTRLQDFTTGSRTLFRDDATLISINIHGYDAAKHGAVSLVGDAKVTLEALTAAIGDYKAAAPDAEAREDWLRAVDVYCARPDDQAAKPTDGQVIGAFAVKARDTDHLEAELAAARSRNIPTVIVIETIAKDFPGTGLETTADEHGYFWDVAVPQVSVREKQRKRLTEYLEQISKQSLAN